MKYAYLGMEQLGVKQDSTAVSNFNHQLGTDPGEGLCQLQKQFEGPALVC